MKMELSVSMERKFLNTGETNSLHLWWSL